WGYEFRRAEFEVTATVESSSEEKRELSDDIGTLINQLRNAALRLSPTEQQEMISKLQMVIREVLGQPDVVITPHLEAIIHIAITVFNAGETLFAAQLIYVVQQIYDWEGFDKVAREGLRCMRKAAELDQGQLKLLTSKPEWQPALRVLLSHFDDLSPYKLL